MRKLKCIYCGCLTKGIEDVQKTRQIAVCLNCAVDRLDELWFAQRKKFSGILLKLLNIKTTKG